MRRIIIGFVVLFLWLVGLVLGNVSAPSYDLLLTVTIVLETLVIVYYGINFRNAENLWKIGFGIVSLSAAWMLWNAIDRLFFR